MSEFLEVVKLNKDATIPKRMTNYSAGYDLFLPYDTIIPAKSTTKCKIGIAISFPEGNIIKIKIKVKIKIKIKVIVLE
jgi:dUTPase